MKAALQDSDDEMEEDDTILLYCSDNGNMEVDDMDSGDSDDDWSTMCCCAGPCHWGNFLFT